MSLPSAAPFLRLLDAARAAVLPAVDHASQGAPLARPTCFCATSRSNYLSRIATADQRRIAANGDWRSPRLVTRPLDWTCTSDAWHAIAEGRGGNGAGASAKALASPVARWLRAEGSEGEAADTSTTASTIARASGAIRTSAVPSTRLPHENGQELSEGGEVLLRGGRIFTNDPGQPWCEALLVRGRHIVATGTSEAVASQAGGAARTIELGGRTVIPGFNDAHMHHTPAPWASRCHLTAPRAGTTSWRD